MGETGIQWTARTLPLAWRWGYLERRISRVTQYVGRAFAPGVSGG